MERLRSSLRFFMTLGSRCFVSFNVSEWRRALGRERFAAGRRKEHARRMRSPEGDGAIQVCERPKLYGQGPARFIERA